MEKDSKNSSKLAVGKKKKKGAKKGKNKNVEQEDPNEDFRNYAFHPNRPHLD